MIEIKNITKVYKSKKKSNHKALDCINLTLPNNGLVFVIGKSGSGKSTLLNLLGGLDSITNGSIIVDGNDITKFNERDLSNYRNNHIGFIFQDYHLLDELTVYENIVLSLNLNRIEDKGKVLESLSKVGLEGYENRYPSELSGGERQRVAIARAIVKNPYVILADEPTGNLDNETGTQIVSLLKELSKECLILIVSHNTIDTYKYADRIIKLSNGKVISDESRNPEYLDGLSLVDNILYYPMDKTLSEEDINIINKKEFIKVVSIKNKYISTFKDENKKRDIKIEKKNLSIKNMYNLCLTFLKSKVFRIVASSLMIAIITVILALAETIITFDSGEIISNEMMMNEQETLLLNKIEGDELGDFSNGKYHVEIGKDDIDKFYKNGYKGKIYPVINNTLPITTYKNSAGEIYSNLSAYHPYLRESLGTIIVSEDFLRSKFGKLEFIAESEKYDPAGIIITDYLADSVLFSNSNYKGKKYEDILGEYKAAGWTVSTQYVNGIINTGYKDKYASLFEKINNKEFESTQDLYEDADYKKFASEIYEKLGFCYSLNSNFIEDYKNTWGKEVPFLQKIIINDIIEMGKDSSDRSYAVSGYNPSNKLVDQCYYTENAPAIPEGAKYIRISFIGTSPSYKVETNPLYYILNLPHAKIAFSDGTVPSSADIDYERGVWLSPDGTSVKKTDFAKSQLSDYIEIPEGTYIKEFVTTVEKNHAYCSFYDEDKNFISSFTSSDRISIEKGTIHLQFENYNQLFGTNYNSDNLDTFVPHPIKITQYRYYDYNNEVKLFEKEYMVTTLYNVTRVDDELAEILSYNQTYCYALYFDGSDKIGTVVDLADDMNYQYQSLVIEGIHTMTKAVDVFIPIFELVAIVLCAGIIFILFSFASKMIKDKMHDIGILKALGCKNNTIGIVFGLQVLLIALCTIILSTIGYFVFIGLANDVLIESLRQLAPLHVVLDLDFLTFKLNIVFINSILVVILTVISFIIPMLKIYRIKPVQIIKAKE